MADSKKKLLNIRDTKYNYADPSAMIRILNLGKQSYFIRSSPDVTSIVVGDKEFLYPQKRLFSSKQLYIFQAVRRNVKAYLEENPDFTAPTAYPTNKTNYHYDDSHGTITGTDINGAYWNIAYMMGFITQKTYESGNKPNMKVARLAALSTLGRQRTYDQYEKGELVGQVTVTANDESMKDIYRAIRYTCYWHMQQMADLLQEDFEAWRTDCIYYRDTPENRQKVHGYLTDHGFIFKQLKYAEKDDSEQEDTSA